MYYYVKNHVDLQSQRQKILNTFCNLIIFNYALNLAIVITQEEGKPLVNNTKIQEIIYSFTLKQEQTCTRNHSDHY